MRHNKNIQTLRQNKYMTTFKKISLKCYWNVFVRTNPGNFCRLSLLHFVLWDLLPPLSALEGAPVCQQWYQGGSVFRLITALRSWLWSLIYLISFGWLLVTEIHSGLWHVFIFCVLFYTSCQVRILYAWKKRRLPFRIIALNSFLLIFYESLSIVLCL